MKKTITILTSFTLMSCASSSNETKLTILNDEVFYQQNTSKIPDGAYINFKLTKITDNTLQGYLIDNILDNNNQVLFMRGDVVSVNKKIIDKQNCSFNLASLNYKNSENYPFIFPDFTILRNGKLITNCSKEIGLNQDIYSIKIVSNVNSPNLPIIVKVDDLTKINEKELSKLNSIYALTGNVDYSVYKNIDLISDNGIQTLIKTNNDINNIYMKYGVESKDYSKINLNYSRLKNNYIVINGVYSDILIELTKKIESEPTKFIEILRKNPPDYSNSILINKIEYTNKLIKGYVSAINNKSIVNLEKGDNSKVEQSPFETTLNEITTPSVSNQAIKQNTKYTTNQNVPPLNTATKIYPLNDNTASQVSDSSNDNEQNSNTPVIQGNGMNIMSKLNFNEGNNQ